MTGAEYKRTRCLECGKSLYSFRGRQQRCGNVYDKLSCWYKNHMRKKKIEYQEMKEKKKKEIKRKVYTEEERECGAWLDHS